MSEITEERKVGLMQNLQKAWCSPRVGKHGTPKRKLLREEMRQELMNEFVKQHLRRWGQLVQKQLEDAFTDRQAREYSFNRILGKPAEKAREEFSVDNGGDGTLLGWQSTIVQLAVGEELGK